MAATAGRTFPGVTLGMAGRRAKVRSTARPAQGDARTRQPIRERERLAADDLNEVVYIDHYGNAMNGVQASRFQRNATIRVHDSTLPHAHVFYAMPEGATFRYENSVGLVEIAANRASAARLLDIRIGDAIEVVD